MPSRRNERQPHMNLVLAFDCAVSGLSVAVVRDELSLASYREEGRDQAASLLPAVASVLQQAGVDRRALSLIAVTVGPGSFTGVRVGLAAARGLAVALGVPLAGLQTTAVLLAQAERHDRLAVAAIDSRLGDWFCALGEAGGGDTRAPFLASTAELVQRLKGRPSLVVGPQAETLAPSLENSIPQTVLPDPVAIARLALEGGIERWRARNRLEGLPRPLYLRGVNITLPDGARRTVE
ncbi:MAG: tRNA (adenosine(37)-N6)-threonylcarbamoyltransferase complex dimerization subunit type 1 TsaB [Reyranellales bacterium]